MQNNMRTLNQLTLQFGEEKSTFSPEDSRVKMNYQFALMIMGFPPDWMELKPKK